MVTATPLPANLATAQALGLSMGLAPIVRSTSTPANGATATYQAEYATAVAMTTGTFTPVPTNAVTPVIIMPTPMPKNVMTAAAQMRTATAVVAKAGTMTPLPYQCGGCNADGRAVHPCQHGHTGEPRPPRKRLPRTPRLSRSTTGTFTPIPASAIRATATPRPTATPAPTPAPLVLYVDQITPQAPPTPLPAQPRSIPADLKGKILFMSDRDGAAEAVLLRSRDAKACLRRGGVAVHIGPWKRGAGTRWPAIRGSCRRCRADPPSVRARCAGTKVRRGR